MIATLDDFLGAAALGEPIRILYHSPCPDGFGAAYCAWTRLGDKATYIPYGHQDAPDPTLFDGAIVAMCDCCYQRLDLLRARAMAKKFLVLDHHKSSMKSCSDVEECVFDMQRSGARMAWDFFRPGASPPALIKHVEDRDLWRHALPGTAAFCSKLGSLPLTFESWDKVALMDEPTLARFMREGSEMFAQFEAQAQSMAESAIPCLFFGRRAYLLNAAYRFASHCGALLLARPGTELAVIWTSRDLRDARVSLRSADGAICDVSVIASALGGGGHASSSGAVVPLARLSELAELIDWPQRFE